MYIKRVYNRNRRASIERSVYKVIYLGRWRSRLWSFNDSTRSFRRRVFFWNRGFLREIRQAFYFSHYRWKSYTILPDTKQSSTQIVEYIKIHKPFLTLNCDDITTKESKDFRLYFSIKAQRVSHASTKRIWPAFFMSKHDFRDCPSPLYFSFRSAPVRWLENNPHWWRHTDQPRSHKSRFSAVTVKINTTCRLYLEMTFIQS